MHGYAVPLLRHVLHGYAVPLLRHVLHGYAVPLLRHVSHGYAVTLLRHVSHGYAVPLSDCFATSIIQDLLVLLDQRHSLRRNFQYLHVCDDNTLQRNVDY